MNDDCKPWAAYMVATALLLAQAAHVLGETNEEVAKAVRQIAPIAAAVNHSDWNKLAMSEAAPKVSDLENQPLTLLIFYLRVSSEPTKEEADEFRAMNTRSSPSEIARAVAPRFSLLVSVLQPSYVKNVTAQVEGDQRGQWKIGPLGEDSRPE